MPLPPPPAAALSSTGIAELLGRGARIVRTRDPFCARHERHAGRAHLGLRARLVAHPLHHVGRRADEDEIVVLARADEVGVLGEEAVAGMHRLAAGRLGRRDERRDAEVALGRGRRPDPHGAIGEPHVERVLVGGRVDGDGLDAELVQRPDHADGDLAAVRDEDSVEHWRSLARQHGGERAAAATQHGLSVRDEHTRHGQLEQRRKRLAEVIVRGLPAQPALRATGAAGSSVARGFAPAPSRTSPTTTAFCRGSQ